MVLCLDNPPKKILNYFSSIFIIFGRFCGVFFGGGGGGVGQSGFSVHSLDLITDLIYLFGKYVNGPDACTSSFVFVFVFVFVFFLVVKTES